MSAPPLTRPTRATPPPTPREAAIRLPDEILTALGTPWETTFAVELAERIAAAVRSGAVSSTDLPDNLIERNMAWRGRVRAVFEQALAGAPDYADAGEVSAAVDLFCMRVRVWRRIMGRRAKWDAAATRECLRQRVTSDPTRTDGAGIRHDLAESLAERLFACTGNLCQIRTAEGLDRRYRRALEALSGDRCREFLADAWGRTPWPSRALAALRDDLARSGLRSKNGLPDTH